MYPANICTYYIQHENVELEWKFYGFGDKIQ